jgi:anti-anti-sigma factor
MKRVHIDRRIVERINLAVHEWLNCDYCLVAHTRAARQLGVPDSEIQLARQGTSSDPAIAGIHAPAEALEELTSPVGGMELQAIGTGQVNQPIELEMNRDRTVATVSMPLAGTGSDDASKAALETLREDVIPATVGRLPGDEVAVTGNTAGTVDFNDAMKASVPIVFGFVLGLAFLLLLVTFRSIVIPIKAIVLNLLSVGAAYGALVLVFQHEWAEGILGFDSNGAIASWLPLFLFVLLFGLSMDYHVFILSRVKGLVDGGVPTGEAVARGIRGTAGTVTSAAAVMVAVFAIFATLSSLDIKQMGVGLAVAVLLDATIVRAVLLPSSMKLLGRWNWYLPRWLEWLPAVTIEGAPAPGPVAVATAAGAGPRDPHDIGVPLRVETDVRPDRVTVALRGELDLRAAGDFRALLENLDRHRAAVTVIDLRGLAFMDSSGLGELVRASRRARRMGRRVVLVTGAEPIDRVLAITGLDKALETTADPATLDN